MTWHAELQVGSFAEGERPRGAARRRLRLNASALTGPDSVDVLIHNLSLTGVLVESEVDIAVGEALEVDMPEAGSTAATVVWKSGDFHGCQFERPISPGALSAAQLRSPAQEPNLVAISDAEAPPTGLHPAAKASIIIGASLWLWGFLILAVRLL